MMRTSRYPAINQPKPTQRASERSQAKALINAETQLAGIMIHLRPVACASQPKHPQRRPTQPEVADASEPDQSMGWSWCSTPGSKHRWRCPTRTCDNQSSHWVKHRNEEARRDCCVKCGPTECGPPRSRTRRQSLSSSSASQPDRRDATGSEQAYTVEDEKR